MYDKLDRARIKGSSRQFYPFESIITKILIEERSGNHH